MTQFVRTVSPALQALLDSGRRLVTADLYTITVANDGPVFAWTGADMPMTIGSDTWSLGPGVVRSKLTRTMGVEGAALEVELFDRDLSPQLVNGVPLIPWILRGGFDDAQLVLEQAFSADGVTWVGSLHLHSGRVADAQTAGRGGCMLTVRSRTEVFNRHLPPSIYQPKCRTRLYSTLCAISRSTYLQTGSATGAATLGRTRFPCTVAGTSRPAGWFDLGVVKFTSGANAGISRTIRQHVSGELILMQPLPAGVVAGDAFQIYPGCDLTLETCRTKYDNDSHFRGMPFVPAPDSVT